jgi:hypothetical protein
MTTFLSNRYIYTYVVCSPVPSLRLSSLCGKKKKGSHRGLRDTEKREE